MVGHPSPTFDIKEGDRAVWLTFWAIRKTINRDEPMSATHAKDWLALTGRVLNRQDARALLAMDSTYRSTLSEVIARNTERQRQEQGKRV